MNSQLPEHRGRGVKDPLACCSDCLALCILLQSGRRWFQVELTLEEVIHELNCLENSLRPFEEKYRIKSAEFHRLVLDGKVKESSDLHEWFGIYQAWLKRRQRYLELLQSDALLVPLTAPIEARYFERALVSTEA